MSSKDGGRVAGRWRGMRKRGRENCGNTDADSGVTQINCGARRTAALRGRWQQAKRDILARRCCRNVRAAWRENWAGGTPCR